MERKIVIALITSEEYISAVSQWFDATLLDSHAASKLAGWALEYYSKYHRPVNNNLDALWHEKQRSSNLDSDLVEEIEEDILPGLSEEYRKQPIDVPALIDQTHRHLSANKLQQHNEQVELLLEKGRGEEAEKLVREYTGLPLPDENTVDVGSDEVREKVRAAFEDSTQPIITFGGALGKFWNREMVRQALIGIMAPEKRGKTWLMIAIARQAARQGRKVALFQAGDMGEKQLLRRLGINLAKRSDKDDDCGVQYIPVKDCVRNQLDDCDKLVRECDYGPMADYGMDEEEVRLEITRERLIEACHQDKDYQPCHNCAEYKQKRWGAVWFKKMHISSPLTGPEAEKYYRQYYIKKNRQLRVDTYANETLSVSMIEQKLRQWEREDKWRADVVLIDYADLLITERQMDERPKQNQIWKSLRRLSQQQNALVITPTQTDAKGHETGLLKTSNFSEDKRKFAHVTAMYGMNQDPKGREKAIGLLRLNKMMVREAAYSITDQVTLLQHLNTGQPIITSYL